jgi:hypothetical protein
MASQVRQFGQEISGNRPRLAELTKESRLAIYTARCAGQSRASLADDFQVSPSTITRTISRFQHHRSFESDGITGY